MMSRASLLSVVFLCSNVRTIFTLNNFFSMLLSMFLHKKLISRLPYYEVAKVQPTEHERAECYALIKCLNHNLLVFTLYNRLKLLQFPVVEILDKKLMQRGGL